MKMNNLNYNRIKILNQKLKKRMSYPYLKIYKKKIFFKIKIKMKIFLMLYKLSWINLIRNEKFF